MANLGLGFPNMLTWTGDALTPSFAGGDWETESPLSNMLTRNRANIVQSVDATNAKTKFTIDWGANVTLRALSILGHNLDANWTIKWSRGSSLTGAEVDVTTDLNVWQFTPLRRDGSVYHICIVRPTATAARYEMIEFKRVSGSIPYVQFAHAMFCDLFVPEVNADYGLVSKQEDLSTKARTDNGSLVTISRPVLTGESFVLSGLSLTEARTVRQMLVEAGTTEEVLYVPDVEDPAAQQADGFVGTFDDTSGIEYRMVARKGVPISLTRD